MRRLQHFFLLFVFAVNRHQHGFDGRNLRWQHQALVVGVAHDQAANQPRAHSPTGLPDVIQLPFLTLELHIERLAEVLAQVVTGAGLQGKAILHHGLNAVGLQRSGELLRLRFQALDHRHGHHILGDFGVHVQHAEDFPRGFLVIGVRGVTLLPKKFSGAQEHAGAQFPADDVGPLVHQHRQVAPAFDPLGEKVADDRLRCGTNDVRLFQLFAAGERDHRQFRREAFHVLGFLVHKTLRDQQWKIHVLMTGGFEAVVQFALQ